MLQKLHMYNEKLHLLRFLLDFDCSFILFASQQLDDDEEICFWASSNELSEWFGGNLIVVIHSIRAKSFKNHLAEKKPRKNKIKSKFCNSH